LHLTFDTLYDFSFSFTSWVLLKLLNMTIILSMTFHHFRPKQQKFASNGHVDYSTMLLTVNTMLSKNLPITNVYILPVLFLWSREAYCIFLV